MFDCLFLILKTGDLSGMWEKILNTSDVTNEEVTHNNCSNLIILSIFIKT